jgi:hypothetical protein
MDATKMMTINLDDANLAQYLKALIAEAEITVGELFDDQDILDHVHDGGMPIDEIFGEDEILGCGCVMDAIAQEREDCEQETIEKYEEEIAELKEENADLTRCNGIQCGDLGDCRNIIGEQNEKIAELEKENAELKKKMERWDETELSNLHYQKENTDLRYRNHRLKKKNAKMIWTKEKIVETFQDCEMSEEVPVSDLYSVHQILLEADKIAVILKERQKTPVIDADGCALHPWPHKDAELENTRLRQENVSLMKQLTEHRRVESRLQRLWEK